MSKGTNTNPVLDVFRDSFDDYDPFGSALNAHFDIAECLHRYGVQPPAAWEFHPSPMLEWNSEEFDEETQSVFAADIDLLMRTGHVSNLIHAGNVLMRYVAQLKLAGKDY